MSTDATVARAFSLTAERYDAFAADHPHLTRMRMRVYAHVAAVVPAGARILELNAGTGTDAVALARRGFHVHATDIAPGMLARIDAKARDAGVARRVTWEPRSFLDLEGVSGTPYDAVLSNLGGLNCTNAIERVGAGLHRALRPGGIAVLVIMPRICLWELAVAVTGDVRLATRRLRRGGTIAHLEGLHFPVHYLAPRDLAGRLGPDFELTGIRGLSVITPTAESKNLARRHPRLYGALARLDDRLCDLPLLRGWGDFAIVTVRRRGRGWGCARWSLQARGPSSAPRSPVSAARW